MPAAAPRRHTCASAFSHRIFTEKSPLCQRALDHAREQARPVG